MSDWKRMLFRTGKVWVRVDDHEQPELTDGKAQMVYQKDDTKVYSVNPASLFELDDPNAPAKPAKKKATKSKAKTKGSDSTKEKTSPQSLEYTPDENTLELWTDGACSGNPGEAGAGLVLKYKQHRKERSHYLGKATNNIAELEAIRLGLVEIKNPRLPVRVFTDSAYSIGVLTKGWKAKANQELIAEIRQQVARFQDIQFIKVEGHAGVEENERVDELARLAISAKKNQVFSSEDSA